MQGPKVRLINHTNDAILTMVYFRRIMHSPVPDTLSELKENSDKYLGTNIDDYFNTVLLRDNMPTFLESVNVLFKIENISRSTTHQMVRHRIGFSYSQQSMRCVRAETFADDTKYTIPKSIKNKELYMQSMEKIQVLYNRFLAEGESTQDARGLLPTAVQTSILVSATLRAIIEMINKRLCRKTQGEFRDVAFQMREEIVNKIDLRLSEFFGPPCEIKNYCMMESENLQQLKEGKLTGEQNTSRVCPNYIKLFSKEK